MSCVIYARTERTDRQYQSDKSGDELFSFPSPSIHLPIKLLRAGLGFFSLRSLSNMLTKPLGGQIGYKHIYWGISVLLDFPGRSLT
jgi:hypothetical protein